MKILVSSDAHSKSDFIKKLSLIKADIYLDAGDSELDANTLAPFISVKGNCDYFPFPSKLIIPTEYGKLYITHRPLSEISLKKLYEEGIRIFIHGHTHVREDQIIEGIRVICPGSVSRPRDGLRPSYCILNITKDAVETTFIDY